MSHGSSHTPAPEPVHLTDPAHARLSRRALLKGLAGAGAAALAVPSGWLAAAPADGRWQGPIMAYLNSLARPDGGFGWDDQDEGGLTPTFAAIGALRALGQSPADPKKLAEFIRTHHPEKGASPLRVHDYRQIQALRWLGDDAADFREKVLTWTKPLDYPAAYEPRRYPVFQHELAAFTCRALLGLPVTDLSPEFIQYLDSRRRANGSFNNTPASEGGNGHVMNTLWGLQALQLLNRLHEKRAETIAWLQACQRPGGGFTWAPQPTFGGVENAIYTWAAVKALQLLGTAPANKEACIKYLASLQNADGGFGDRPGWLSNPLATYYALDALAALDALNEKTFAAPPPAAPRAPALPAGLRVFTIQIESHGQGSPAEAVDLARALKIDLWGAKNGPAGWLERAQALADAQKAPVKFFTANEGYGIFVDYGAFGVYSHTSDYIVPAGSAPDTAASLVGPTPVAYEDFRARLEAPIEKAGGRLVWQFGENEELVRAILDDSIQRGGYAAIATFHFGNPDFCYTEPFLSTYRGQIPFYGIQDAHGPEPWFFSDMTTGFRTLFLATEPTWEGWMNALKNNWVAAVRHDAVTAGRTRFHAGSPGVLEFVKKHEMDWRWWDNPAIARPLVTLVALHPDDPFESGRPAKGVALRVRCQWENTTQGQPKTPRAEFVSLTVDGKKVDPQPLRAAAAAGKAKGKKKAKGKGPAQGAAAPSSTWQYLMQSPAPGRHRATVTVRELATGRESTRTLEFTV